MGWCTVAPDTTTPETCTGTTFQPGGDFGIDQTTLNNTTLYAMWKIQVPVPTGSIQDFTLQQCQYYANSSDYTLTDTRDDNTYTVRYINGNCWMTQNLRLAGGTTLTSADSNVASSWSFPDNSLSSSGTNYIGDTYTTAGYVVDSTYGGYYNFCAASAGTVCSKSMQDVTYDICPKGWRLPTQSEFAGIVSYSSAFSPVYSGYYHSGSLVRTGSYGYWWSSTASVSSSQYSLHYYSGSLGTSYSYGNKFLGYSVRCIRSTAGTLTINFDGNGATGGSTASQQIAAGNTTNLNANGFNRTNYDFTGWNTAADGSGISYNDQASYTVTPATGNATVTLYAQWGLSMQDFTLAQCQSQASSSNVTVVDSRDNNSYTVRYINGNCWMTQNLRLSGGRTLTSADSNVASSWSFPSTELAGNSYSYTAPQSTISSNTSYGGYYNFCAASAGTNCQSSTQYNTTYDICPKGWRLPTYNEQQGITSYSSAFSPVYSGFYYSGSLSNTGSYGYWWSSTAYYNFNQYYLYYVSGSLSTRYNVKYYGFSVRCVRSS